MKRLTEMKKTGAKSSKSSIKGKQILVGGLVILVAVAGYYRYSVMNTPKPDVDETVPVISTAVADENYFSKTRLECDSDRSEAEELLEGIVNDEEATADAKAKAREKMNILAENIKNEGEIEGLVKSKGYEDCIAFIDDEEIRIIVKADKLDEEKVSQIAEIVTSRTEFKPSQIIISNHK